MPTFGDWDYSIDRSATLKAYAAVEHGSSEACDCVYCRNFQLARPSAFPAAFLALLDQLGIDPRKDGEIYHIERISLGLHEYGGWFHFVGALHQTGDFSPVGFDANFKAWMCHGYAPRLDSLSGLFVVQLEFQTRVPWLLSEQEPR